MAQITHDHAKKYRYLGREEETDSHHTQEETLRDKLLKDLFLNQTNVNFTFKDVISKKREFLKSSIQESSTTSGLLSYDEFSNVEENNHIREILLSCNLTQAEINYLFDVKANFKSTEAEIGKLKAIEDKLAKRDAYLHDNSKEHFSGAKALTRHEYEEEIRKEPLSSEANKLSSCLLYLKPHSDPSLHPEHPLNHLSQLEEELFPKHNVFAPKRKRKQGDFEPQIEWPKKSLWDITESLIEPLGSTPVQKSMKVPSIKAKKLEPLNVSKPRSKIDTDYSKPFIWPVDSGKLIPLSEIKENGLSVQQVREIERFKDYDPGNPNKTLFIKNLPKSLSPHILPTLFGNFESANNPKIQYRILRGKMKGQAFIKFPNEETATCALKTCLGYPIDNKPLVIQFGNK